MHLQRVVSVESELYEDIDAVLISHAHYDHLDVPSLRKIGRSVRVIVPRGGRGFLRRRAFPDVVQLAEGDETIVGDVRVRAVFAEHSNMRASTIALSPALGYVISGSQRVYFAGDTDLFPGMEGLASDLDVALLPIEWLGPVAAPRSPRASRGGRSGQHPVSARRDSDPLGDVRAPVPWHGQLPRSTATQQETSSNTRASSRPTSMSACSRSAA